MDKFIDKNYIIENLEKVINDKDEVIIFYIGIWTFIRHLNINSVNIAEEFIKIIEEFLGEKKTIILPSFTANEFVKTKKFDIKLSIPKSFSDFNIDSKEIKEEILRRFGNKFVQTEPVVSPQCLVESEYLYEIFSNY